ncbi:adenine phosphoribosyltransferase [Alkaliphilus metalliredigens QYMF]|uniref:Adenine phosphoribosyltransferase n=1 Tax=Alkaliphilus metalliredigens (strain QYMF) TaxID=293826 RepID=APT_ALKMQ|nr:adenine phosphoribosyltransferase [Alkaliphilus metalliredigens]A6TQN8.1 RecName: Full=Adenine phosphoribosyltransferase; Short=APRT [Alkaliphilus metalliredigens QYMF]ABR48506.1 adenine phosphoribosyltransferase [Alkaliphilus metalliredigens QYMF]
MNLDSKIRVIEDFPKKGISFKDITTLLKDKEAFRSMVDQLSDQLIDLDIDIVVGPEARGFLVGAPVAYKIGAGFVPIRKPGKLPGETISYEYELEYGTDSLEIHTDAIQPGQRVAILDDLLATGGTVVATAKLIEELGGEVVSINFLIELGFLNGGEVLKGYSVKSLLKY